jgi:hypothetical protein
MAAGRSLLKCDARFQAGRSGPEWGGRAAVHNTLLDDGVQLNSWTNKLPDVLRFIPAPSIG